MHPRGITNLISTITLHRSSNEPSPLLQEQPKRAGKKQSWRELFPLHQILEESANEKLSPMQEMVKKEDIKEEEESIFEEE